MITCPFTAKMTGLNPRFETWSQVSGINTQNFAQLSIRIYRQQITAVRTLSCSPDQSTIVAVCWGPRAVYFNKILQFLTGDVQQTDTHTDRPHYM